MNLSEHFVLEELTRSDTALRMGIDNSPGIEALANLSILAAKLERVRAILNAPIHILSGFRCEELERVIAGKDFVAWRNRHGDPPDAWADYFSRKGHPKGFCADFVAPMFGSPKAIAHRLGIVGIKFDQLIEEGTWVHLSVDPRMRGEILTATFNNGIPAYVKGAV